MRGRGRLGNGTRGWFWDSRGLIALADHDKPDEDMEDFMEITRRINGGTVPLEERLAAYKLLRKVLP